ncbi:peptidylprolyl isomerase [Shewanella salipaludis]|uniref:Peptidyl-prolyl cis-trans isomerase n=1 Tax=Shewanella salipaludis TaxID=2723052 RepID=A0A972FR68_9GAMM|nr:peptidylprolyl isomerase [Shewanella salipaludis]NMH64668.1 peptidylprolyl isomerase [Shewanella salipaludis]
MKKLLVLTLSSLVFACGSGEDGNPVPPPVTPPETPPSLEADICYLMSTSMGEIRLAIDLSNTQVTGQNFKQYADKGFYDGTLFHRAIDNFVIQGGGFTTELTPKPADAPIKNEASVGLSNKRGTLAMARTNDPDSATSQFFINILDNPQLDASASSYGYAVFGEVTQGMEVVDQISIVETATVKGMADVPKTEVLIDSLTEVTCN